MNTNTASLKKKGHHSLPSRVCLTSSTTLRFGPSTNVRRPVGAALAIVSVEATSSTDSLTSRFTPKPPLWLNAASACTWYIPGSPVPVNVASA